MSIEKYEAVLEPFLLRYYQLMRRYFSPVIEYYLETNRLAQHFPHFKDAVCKRYNPFINETLEDNIDLENLSIIDRKDATQAIEISKGYRFCLMSSLPSINFSFQLVLQNGVLKHFYHTLSIEDFDSAVHTLPTFFACPIIQVSDLDAFECWSRDFKLYVIYLAQETVQALEDYDEIFFFDFYVDKRNDVWNLQHLPSNPPRLMHETIPYAPSVSQRIYEEFERRMNLP